MYDLEEVSQRQMNKQTDKETTENSFSVKKYIKNKNERSENSIQTFSMDRSVMESEKRMMSAK